MDRRNLATGIGNRSGACLALLISALLCVDTASASPIRTTTAETGTGAFEFDDLKFRGDNTGRVSRIVLAQQIRRPSRFSPADDPRVQVAQQTRPGGRPQSGESAQDPISINFEDVPLMTVIESIGAQTGKNFDVDPAVGGQTVTIISHSPVPANLAYEILESILASRGFALLETLDGNLIKVVDRRGQMDLDKVKIFADPDAAAIAGYDSLAIYVIRVKHADAEDVAKLLTAAGSKASNIDVYRQTNTLLVRDTADGYRNMMRLLEAIDIPGQDVALEIFTLKYTRAEALVEQIREVLGDQQTGQPGQRPPVPTPAQRARAARGVPGARGQAPNVVGDRQQVLRMVPDERLNALIVVASAPLMDQVKFLVGKLDTPTPFEANNMHYVELDNADAEEVETALTAITAGSPREGGAQGGAQQAEVQPFEKNVAITRYDQNNALLIVASPQDFNLLSTIIERLDTPRRQVNIEAIIMEVTIDDAFELTVEGAGIAENSIFALSNVVNLANVIALGPLALAGPGGTIGIIDGTTDIINPITGNLQTVQNVPFLLRALETITELEVLSQPNLLTVDNVEAVINVGQEIPVLQSVTDTDDRTGFRSRGNINRQDIGVMLQVTPQIGEGDFVFMEIEIEVSSAVESSVSIDVNELGPTLQKSNILSSVVIGDGQTGIIGGLIRETRDRRVSQTPIVGDLPLIGWLFRNKRSGRAKQNLVVLVTPHVLKRGVDMQTVTDFRVNEFYNENMDVIFEEGFIRKIKRKHHKREKYHPTRRYQQTEGPQRNFNRAIPGSASSKPSVHNNEVDFVSPDTIQELEPVGATPSQPQLQILSSPMMAESLYPAQAETEPPQPYAREPSGHILVAAARPEELDDAPASKGEETAVEPDSQAKEEPRRVAAATEETTAEDTFHASETSAVEEELRISSEEPDTADTAEAFEHRVTMEDLEIPPDALEETVETEQATLPAPVLPEQSEVDSADEAAPRVEAQEATQRFTVQIGAFINVENANSTKIKFEDASPYAAHVIESNDADVIRVTVGSFLDKTSAETFRDRLREDYGFSDCFVKERDPIDPASTTEMIEGEGMA